MLIVLLYSKISATQYFDTIGVIFICFANYEVNIRLYADYALIFLSEEDEINLVDKMNIALSKFMNLSSNRR